MNKVSGQIEEFFSIGAIWLLFLVNMMKKISLSVAYFGNYDWQTVKITGFRQIDLNTSD